MKKAPKLFSATLLIVATIISKPSFGQMKIENEKATSEVSTTMLQTNMRKLWEDHITWTRNVVLCLVDDLPGTKEAVNRLLQNQVEIGNAIKPYYGIPAGEKLTELLYAHINIAAEVIKAAKAGNTAVLEEATKRWNANADDISIFLSKANPNWALADMKMMMDDHLKITTDEVVSRIKKDYNSDIIAYDKVHIEILKMSDMLADGIVKQFPEKFKTTGTKTASK